MKPIAQAGKFIEDAVKDDPGEGDHLAHRMAERIGDRIRAHVVHEKILMGAAVDRDGAAQAFGFAVDRPIFLRAQVRHVDAHRRQHGAAETEIAHDPAQLDHRFRRLLQRDQAHRLEARAFRRVRVVHPIIISARQLDGPVAADDLAEGEPGAGVKHGGADAHVFEKKLPAFAADVGEGALRREVAVGGMQMIDGRKRIFAARFGKTSADVFFGHVFDDARDVFDHMTVAVDDFLLR